MRQKKYGYIYKTTCLSNKKIYIGKHMHDPNEDFYSYLGSGKYFQNALKKNGKECFKKEILDWCNDFKDMCLKETYWVNFYYPNGILKEIGYNLVIPNGENAGFQWTDEMKENLRDYFTIYSIKDLHKYAKKKGGFCLSTEFINSKFYYKWQCGKCNYIWDASWDVINNGNHWCPQCAGNFQPLIEDLQCFARNKGGKCLSTKYINAKTKYNWLCGNCGNIWKAQWDSVKHGTWCPQCGLKKRAKSLVIYSIEDLHTFAHNKGGKCLSTEYKNSNSKYKWLCGICGYIWKAQWDSVKLGTWCPNCAGKCERIEDLHEFAIKKGGKCLSKEYKNSKSKYKWQCGKCDYIWLSKWYHVKNSGSWCPQCAGRPNQTIQMLYDFANEKKGKGKCLSTEYINAKSKYIWQCGKCDHIWEATWDNIKHGSWCPKCGGTFKNSIKDLHIFAEKKGGKCLSTKYIDNKTKYIWQCGECHYIWNAQWNNVKNNGNWCPKCGKKEMWRKRREH